MSRQTRNTKKNYKKYPKTSNLVMIKTLFTVVMNPVIMACLIRNSEQNCSESSESEDERGEHVPGIAKSSRDQ